MRKIAWVLAGLLLLSVVSCDFLLFYPKKLPEGYVLRIRDGQTLRAVARQLQEEGAVFRREAVLAAAYGLGTQHRLKAGSYRLSSPISAWSVAQVLAKAQPDKISVRIIEGQTWRQIRANMRHQDNIRHTTAGMSDMALLEHIAPESDIEHLEGLFFPDTYVTEDDTDLAVYRMAYRAMQNNLQAAWDDRDDKLPYRNPYELLIMASIIEKETALNEDRALVAAVFVNRLKIGMRLQTDPTVIYGMGEAYHGNIRKADLLRDTPYNTYTRAGLPPTPISAPTRASLEAAAHPADVPYLYFVAKKDGTGSSQFSTTLDEHNAAVRRYILKR